ncbi:MULTISPECIES: pseudouridine synthase [Nocardia]|uniref:pseudouridine synthase n=1 Tax=Nocardia TaxID=1817 RepID=UPI0009EE669E|nr:MULTISPECIES: pseudouridine synthase [Nocardia]MBF6277634.1 pseudouridine synthase [Nocardia nova]
MNTPARRDGTPDRRKRHSDPPRGGGRAARGAAGRADRSDDRRGDRYGRRDDSYGRGDTRGSRPGREDDRYGRGGESYGRGGDRSGRGDDRYNRGGESYGRGDSAGRGSRSEGGYSRGDRFARGQAAGDARGDSRYGRGDARPSRGDSPAGSRDRGTAAGRPRAGAPKPKKRKTPPTVLSFAKPARHQHVEAEQSGPKKLPWGEGERLQKVLAKAGVASRRAAEELIEQGRVEVDGAVVREQGLRIDPDTAVVRVDGVRVVVRDEQVYLALNKPKGFQSTMSDELGRPCVGDIVAERVMAGQRLFHVGRLDADTEGLLLLTNDGDLAHRLMHPSFQVSKTYLATVQGEMQRGVGKQLRDGVELEDGPAKVDKFQVLEVAEGKSLVRVILHEGRKHIVRRLLAEVGYPVIALVRTHIGPVALGDQRSGTLRVLGRDEIGKLYEAVEL